MEEVNLQEVKDKLNEKLKASGWSTPLFNFIMTSDFDDILSFLLRDAQDGKRFTPKIKDVFKAFEACPLDKTRVVVIGQDPYPQIDVADGIAFSCSKKGKIEKSLEYMYKSIEKTTEIVTITDPDLSRWSNQGMLLLNSALTTTIGKPGSHQLLWKPFMAYVIDYLVWNKTDLIYVFLGKKAQEFADLVPDNNHKIFVTHPASAGYEKQAEWDCNDMWNKINKYLEENGQQRISW
jgi:uracil-DNA glycosylase